MTELKTGDHAPNFTLPIDGNKQISLSPLKGQNVIVYFYPKDNTPGCTKQACAFRDDHPAFKDLNTQIIGISKDSVTKHDKFKQKYTLNFPLASDEDGKVCESYGTWVEKNLYGKKYMGIERTTFLIDSNGKINTIWRKVKVANHIEDVKNALRILNSKTT